MSLAARALDRSLPVPTACAVAYRYVFGCADLMDAAKLRSTYSTRMQICEAGNAIPGKPVFIHTISVLMPGSFERGTRTRNRLLLSMSMLPLLPSSYVILSGNRGKNLLISGGMPYE